MGHKDPVLKLFGKTIPLPPAGEIPVLFEGGEEEEEEEEKDHKDSISESKDKPNESSKTESIATSESKEEEDQKHTTSKQQDKPQPPKKPDKILPCPRCNSMDTKFCYFNNYNVNQPRHFCKHCERYWTAGGSMRNVPVGAGRRKHKSSASLSRHLNSNDSGAMLNFSTSKVFAEQQNGDEQSTGSTVTASNSAEEGEQQTRNLGQTFPSLMSCFNGTPWPYPWTPVSFYAPAGYWGWSIPWQPPPLPSPPETVHLGKHSRDDESHERGVWMPKTLRIDDPEEAAKSSIWASMGIKNFKAFEPKTVVKTNPVESSEVLRANPAAFSQSLNFQESL